MDNLETRLLLAFEDAIATRGRHKGRLKAQCPKMNTDGAIMWQACMQIANPYKASIFAVMFCADREFYQNCVEFAESRASVLQHLDRDRVALSRMGAW